MTAGLISSVVHGGWADVSVCVTDDSATSSAAPAGLLPEPGAQLGSVPRYCAENPGTTLRLLNQLGDLPSTLLLISGLFLLHRLLQGAARDGVYTAQTASRLRLLVWWLLLGSLVAEIIESNARAAVLADLARTADFTAGTWLGLWSPPWLAVLTGLGLLTFARITRAGAAMREDLEGVV
ncbi:hypothetical protein [Streptomyces pseudovenezuelae]|uniref:DUF2975 domain-containing protein n=1 Tax=Streptomyces pseudovenezuelae TaxID=67350 RepID=A0ABT6M0S0_9ACTN|nr:hypothetical protein [Streptomyces pseudovenezuelae]MDH6221234.1 hypothetical protein [Streptomyces pseudovenezuelae]